MKIGKKSLFAIALLLLVGLTSRYVAGTYAKYASEIKDNQRRNNSDSIRTLIDKYNQLKNIAITLKTMKLNIPVREMSNNNNYGLDIDKLSKTPKLVLK